jgi:hypothetical protein
MAARVRDILAHPREILAFIGFAVLVIKAARGDIGLLFGASIVGLGIVVVCTAGYVFIG